jgi:DNA-binding MarR family transcriptional regulator
MAAGTISKGDGRVNDRKHRAAEWTDEALERASCLTLEEYFFYLILQVNRRRDVALARALEPVGLSLPKWRALAVIGRLGGCAMTELAEFSVVDRTTLTRTVDQLVADGLVQRAPSPSDRRLVLLGLTEAGRAAAEQARAAAGTANRRILKGVDELQTRAALAALLRAADNMMPDSDDAAYGVLTFNSIYRQAPQGRT